jgi:transposase
VEFLKALRAQLKRKLLIVWDGAAQHKSRVVREFLDATRGTIQMALLPGYSPDLNPVEYLWAWLKRHALANFCPNSLAELKTTARSRRQSRFKRERMMDQRDQRCAPGDLLRCLRQRAERQAVDHDRDSLRQGLEPRQRNRALLGAGLRKSFAHRDDADLPAELQFRDDAPVVSVTAGRSRKIARHRKRDAIHHRGAS